MRSVGIDIGTYSVKIAEIEGSNRNFTLRDYLEVPFALDLTQDKKVQIIDVLRKIASHYDPAKTKFAIAISQDMLSVRHKTFPFREKNKISKSLPFELEDEVPFDPSNAVFDAKILRYKEKFTEVLAAICPQSQVNEILNLAQDAGIDPDIITSDGFALSNILTNWDEAPPEADALTNPSVLIPSVDEEPTQPKTSTDIYIHMGHSKSIVMLMQGPLLLEVRSINFGGLVIATRIQKTYEIGLPEAMKGLQEKGFVLTKTDGASQDQVVFSKAISIGLDKFIFDLKKTILELESQFDVSVNQIHLMGGVSHLVNIAPYMTSKLGVVTNIYNPLITGFKIACNESTELVKNSAVAIGIAIEGLKKPKNPALNFRKGDLAKTGRSFRQFWDRWNTTVYYAATFFGILLVYGIIKSQLAGSMESKARDTVKKIAAAPDINIKGDSTSVKKYIREKKKEVSDAKKLSGLQFINSPLDIVNQISKFAPPKKDITLDIRKIKIEFEDVFMEGEVSQRSEIDLLKQELKKVARAGKITESTSKLPPAPGKINFALTFKVDRKPGAIE